MPSAAPFASDGQGPNARTGIALCHGFTGSPQSIVDWGRHLAAQGYAVRVPRLPGHGTRWQDLAVTPWQQWYKSFEAEYLDLASYCDQVFVAGLSMGGAIALQVAARHPAAGILLVNPALTFKDPKARFAGLLKYVKKTVQPIGDDIKKPDTSEGAYDLTPTAAVHQLRLLFLDAVSALPTVTAPTIIFRSSHDNVVPESSLALIRRRLGSRSLEVVRLDDSFHVATVDNDAPLIFDRSTAFVQALQTVRNHE